MATKSLDLSKLLGVPDLDKHLRRVQVALEAALPIDNTYLATPALRLVRAGGKRLRPALVIAIVVAGGKPVTDKVIAGGVAIELLHIASLVHDDIIDAAATRWNIPTVSGQEGLNNAILVGDFLFAKALDVAASAGIASMIARAFVELCDGQSNEMKDNFNPGRTVTTYMKAIQGKTAALMSAACQVGVTLAGLTDVHRRAFASYGREYGLAFQIIDDVLDLFSTPELLRKPTGNDIREGVYTLPLLYSLQGPNAAKLKKLLKTSSESSAVARLLLDDGSFQKAVEQTLHHARKAGLALKGLNIDESLSVLGKFPAEYISWSLDNRLPKPRH